MADLPKPTSESPTLGSSAKPHSTATKPQGGRQRIIASCLTCRRRKVRCDHGHPVCGACARGNHACTYATDQGLGQASLSGSSRISKPTLGGAKGTRNTDIQARLDRLELLLEKAVSGQEGPARPSTQPNDHDSREPESQLTPSSNSQSSHGAGISSDSHDGTLLLEDGQSQFVSSLHWALLADEIQDIKALLGDGSQRVLTDRDKLPNPNSLISLLSLGRARIGITLKSLLPHTQEHCDTLLELFFCNVDPMIRVVHKPTLIRKFPIHIRETNPIAFAVFYSAINALPPSAVEVKFGEKKDCLLERFEQGIGVSLARENYLTTSSTEVLQGFIIWLTCITKEDDMGKVWALLGLAIRIGLNQGLHRDPSLFPPGSMDAVTIEIRRRLWHQICHLEYRAAECKGQEPNISDDDFTTLLPRNIEDDELVEGASPGPTSYDDENFTDMTFQLVRFVGMRTLRRIVQSTYRLERRMLESGLHGTSGPDPMQELTNIYEQIKVMVDEMHEENQSKYLRFCNAEVPLQRLCLGLASLLEWRCYLLFWLRMPRTYRDAVFSVDLRKSIFEKSINLIETLNGASVDVDAARFQWHIGGHASFQAIMHILSELRSPMFDAPDRQRALDALQMSRILKENNTTKAWSVVKGMIDKVIGKHTVTQNNFISPTATALRNPSEFGPQKSMVDFTLSEYVDQIPPYAIQQPDAYVGPSTQPPLDWGELNLNNIVGMDIPDVSQTAGLDVDWGFWGDPVNLAPMEYPMNF
ncbi:hypothetical protein K469DRAFT_588693 [Zopfia rhizophila CBS 207.26]|uniref:Zn(2)-C6 fungal-type domain-containing protein n=1 Tax=Zopfia rhizophila CBS 207.26 TaxID=1314779 RepID=A0A6A6DQ41_9PEZI|nr:hypothetical protein K469DRAFT_588693 [Zopfia rhizophila CBS 207.26]